MRSYHVPVGVYVDAETPEEARELVLSALNGIDSWNELLDLGAFEIQRISTVTIANADEVEDAGEPAFDHEAVRA